MNPNLNVTIVQNFSQGNFSSPTSVESCRLAFHAGVVILLANSISCVVGTLGNIFVWAAFLYKPRLRIRTSISYFLLNLALSDLLVTMVAQPTFMLRVSQTMRNICIDDVSFIYRLTSSISCSSSVATLGLVSIDRYISLKQPLKYKSLMTKPRVVALILLMWAISVFFLVIQYIYKEGLIWKAITMSSIFLTYAVVISMQLLMFKPVSKDFIKRVYRRSRKVDEPQIGRTIYEKEKWAAVTVSLIIILFTIGWLPFTINILVKEAFNGPDSRLIGYSVLTPGLINSSVNPIIYCLRSQEFRVLLRRMCVDSSTRIRRVVCPNDLDDVEVDHDQADNLVLMELHKK